MTIKEYFELLFPLLLITWMVSVLARLTGLLKLKGQISKPMVIVVSIFITFYPFRGLSMAEYLLSLNPIYSIGSIAFFFIILWKQFGWRPLLSNKNLLRFSIWNVVVSLCLFISYLGFVDFDLYVLGYGFSVWFVITALLTIILFLFRNPLSYVFIVYIAAFDLRLLPSDNLFDYITDGLLFLISIIIVIFSIINFIGLKSKNIKNKHKNILKGFPYRSNLQENLENKSINK